jgi:hypothetical protein
MLRKDTTRRHNPEDIELNVSCYYNMLLILETENVKIGLCF